MFNLETVGQVRENCNRIVEQVKDKGWTKIRGIFERDYLRESLVPLYQAANHQSRLASAGVVPSEIQKNSVKWSIGGYSATQSGLSRMMVTVYNPLSAENVYRLHDAFSRLIEVRDALANRELLTDERLAPERWNGCRVQIYPAGGGFMGAHEDTRAAKNLTREQRVYIQLVLLLTERGTDYQTGGAFVESNGQICDSEDETQTGDVIVYDGNTMHGVADIDSTEVFDSRNLRGRAVALATIYNKQ